MVIVVACHTGDQELAVGMFQWIAELGRVNTHCIVECSRDCDIQKLISEGQKAFVACTHMLDAENIKCNWGSDDPGARDPSGPNSVFRQAAWHVYLSVKQPWLWLEPDCRPLTRDWFEVIKAEYEANGKPVMGDYITTNSPHISGVAVYPYDLPVQLGKMVNIPDRGTAFDVADAQKVIANAHITQRIQDCWCTKTWNEQTFSRIRPEAVLFAGTKNDDLLPFVRRKLGIKAESSHFLPPIIPEFVEENQKTKSVWEFRSGQLVRAA